MVPISDPKTWVPYWNTSDCSLGFCSKHCPQFCYKIFPPQPPFLSHDQDNPSPYFSPLVIAIIGTLASGFILISYYAIMSKYCRNRNGDDPSEVNGDRRANLEPFGAGKNGLDEERIKSIASFKYKKADGVVVDASDCSVCLSEFQEDETLRLLPKCSHAFHVSCIDTWLKSHSNCPLCRANIAFKDSSSSSRNDDEQSNELQESGGVDNRDSVISIDDNLEGNQEIAMNYVVNQGRLSVADILRIDDGDDCDHFQDSQFRNTLSLSMGKFLFPKLNRAR